MKRKDKRPKKRRKMIDVLFPKKDPKPKIAWPWRQG